MKWFLVLIVVLNLAVAGYGSLKQRPPADVHAQEVSPEQVKLLPPDWKPASAPVVVAQAAASAPVKQVASMPQPEILQPGVPAKLASQPLVSVKDNKADASRPDNGGSKKTNDAKPAVVAKNEAAKAEPPAVLACYDWGVLDDKLLSRVKGGLPALKLKSEQVVETAKGETKANGKFWVYHPPLATQAETQTLSAELKDKGFDNYIVHNDNFKGSVSLGLFGREDAAKAMLAKITAAGFDKVAIEQKGPKGSNTMLSFKALDQQQADKLKALQKRLTPGIALQACH